MSARDDYPKFSTAVAERMCEEIDMLRRYDAALRAEIADKSLVNVAKDELIRELTKHADAMSVAIKDITSATDDNLDYYIRNADGHAEAYDQFIKEA